MQKLRILLNGMILIIIPNLNIRVVKVIETFIVDEKHFVMLFIEMIDFFL